jgi:hypothetical protein
MTLIQTTIARIAKIAGIHPIKPKPGLLGPPESPKFEKQS